MSTTRTITTALPIGGATPTFSDSSATAWPIDISEDGLTIYGTNGVGKLYTSVDDAVTWTLAHDFVTTYVLEFCVPAGDGEVLVGVRDRIYKSTGWAANPATATWAIVRQAGSTGDYYSGRYGGISMDPRKTGLGFAAEWGSHYNETTPGSLAAIYVYKTTDFGATWTQVFDLSQWAPIAAQVAGNGFVHMHGCTYDPYWDRVWACFGDNNMQSAGSALLISQGLTTIIYSDDHGATWSSVPWPAGPDDGSNSVFQSVMPVALPGGVIFLPDSFPLGGLNRIGRTGFRQMTKLESLSGAPYEGTGVGRKTRPPRQPGLPCPIVTSERLYVTTDGYTFRQVFQDTQPLTNAIPADGGVQGLECCFVSGLSGKLIGTSNDGRFTKRSKFVCDYLDV